MLCFAWISRIIKHKYLHGQNNRKDKGIMKVEAIQNWLQTEGTQINSMIRIMCSLHIKDDTYDITINSSIGGDSYCSVNQKKHKILIHVGICSWFIDDHESHEKYVKILGREPNEDDLFAKYMGSAMHEFMHACITRTGDVLDQLVLKFPMRNKSATKFQKDFYKINVRKVFHFLHNAVCDARIENIGKNMYNIAQYFDFGRLLDYSACEESSGSDMWDFGYALLQLGVIGKLPKYELSDEAMKAINAIVNSPVKGSNKSKDLLDEFICEPHPTISVRKFAAWFDIPEVHSYIADLIYESIESYGPQAETLKELLEKQLIEVRLEDNAGPLDLEIPLDIKPKKPIQNQPQNNNSSSGQGGESNPNGDGSEEGDGSAKNSEKSSNQADGGSNGSSGNGASDNNKQGVEEDNGSSGSNQNSGNEESENEQENPGGGSTGDTENSEDNDQENSETGQNKTAENEDDQEQDGNSNENKSDHENSQKNKGEFQDQYNSGDKRGSYGNDAALEENGDIRKALDEAIESIAKTAKTINQKTPKKKKGKLSGTSKAIENSDIEIDDNFVPDMMAPKSVVRAAKPLRQILKKAFCENDEDEVVGLKAGTVNPRSLYKLQQKDLSIFKERRLPNINSAAYYFLWDGSGSMSGTKQTESGFACAVLEEAVRGLYPLKIVNFSTTGKVKHYIVKEFDSKTKKNAAYSFAAKRPFNGGNKDGYSIRYAASELMKRPEQNKFLIVLSDGLPSDYSSHENAIADVKSAVKFARENQIDVTSIFFGSSSEQSNYTESYEEMYGAAHIISCDPTQIVSHMIAIIKKNIFK